MNTLPPLNALRAFEAAARLHSMTAAARELSVTHGAVSRQIGNLEDYLGVSLFHRDGRRLRLTRAGERLFPAARSAFELLSAGCRQALAEARPVPLQVASPGTYLLRWLIPRLHRWQAHAPDLEVRLATRAGPVDFRRDGVDVLIDVGKPPWPADWRVTELFHETFGPVASPALLASQPVERPADLRILPRLHTTSRMDAWQEWAGAVGEPELALAGGQTFAQLLYMLEAAVAGIGVALAPAVLVREDLAAGRLQAPLGFVASGSVYFMASAPEAADARVGVFRDWLLAETEIRK